MDAIETKGLIRCFSAPGRVEIGGNHTDHQHGRVLAAAVGLEIKATAKVNGTDIVNTSGKFPCSIDLRQGDLMPVLEETGTSAALIRGVAAWFTKNRYAVGGFDADISSIVPVGSGLSSSAAFEVLIGNIFKGLFGAEISRIELAQAGQFAENIYFGKPCGLMDQAASSFGGLNVIDFKNPNNTVVTPVVADIPGYSMCVVETGGSHADLTPDYAAIPNEMKAIAAFFDKEYLSEVPAEEFYPSINKLRHLGDRAVLRAIHFFNENERVLKQAAALESGDTGTFLDLVIESGRSSLAYLQNVFSPASQQEQGLTIALALSERILTGTGAWRVHGGGFAGTILAFVPDALKDEYNRQMCGVFGESCCHFLQIRKEGGTECLI
jgi:galactokinase